MRIVERYPFTFTIVVGRGFGVLFIPIRAILAFFYWLWISFADRGGVVGNTGPVSAIARETDGARVISVGNLEVGGGGKTPCAIALAQAIIERGGSVVVVTRGYRSVAARYSPFVVSADRSIPQVDGIEYTTEEAYVERFCGSGGDREAQHLAGLLGDEVTLYRRRNIPVVIDPKRVRGIEAAKRLFAPTHIVLDDAYQQRSVPKDLDILLLDALDPLRGRMLLPLGVLREKPSAIRRADAVIFTRAAAATVPRTIERYVAGKPVLFSRHQPIDLVSRDGEPRSLSYLDGRRVSCFSGIARPETFERLVRSLHADIDVSFRFIDHHEYSRGDVEMMIAAAGSAVPFVTTEKDWVKVAHMFPDNVEILALRIAMEIDGIGVLFDLLDRI